MDVIVVDDEALVREIVVEGLVDDGLKVTEVASAEHAIAVAEAVGAPAVVVTDVNLGQGMSGLALVSEVHRRWPEVGVLIVTGTPASVHELHPVSLDTHLSEEGPER